MNNAIKTTAILAAVLMTLCGVATISVPSDGQTYTVSTADELGDAITDAVDGDTIALAADIAIDPLFYTGEVDVTVGYNWKEITADITLELGDHTITWDQTKCTESIPYQMNFFGITGDVVINADGGGIDVEALNNGSYGINVLGGSLTVNGGTYTGAPTAIQVQTGSLIVNDGNFSLSQTISTAMPDWAVYVVNCIDANYKDGTATIELRGGTYGYDYSKYPEGEGTTYVPDGYGSFPNGDGTYTVDAVHTLTFTGNPVITQEVRHGTVAEDVPDLPSVGEGYSVGWFDSEGDPWDPSTPVTSDLTLTAVKSITDITAEIRLTDSSAGGQELIADFESSVDYDNAKTTYAWGLDGTPLDATTSNIVPDGFGTYTVTVTIYDADGVSGSAKASYTLSSTHTLTFHMPDGTVETVSVEHGEAVGDLPMPPVREHYAFSWMDQNGQGVYSDTVIDRDLDCTGAYVMCDIDIDLTYDITADGVYLVADWTPAVELTEYDTYWDINGATVYPGDRVLMDDTFDYYQFCVQGTDVNGEVAYADWGGSLSIPDSEDTTVTTDRGNVTILPPAVSGSTGDSVSGSIQFETEAGTTVSVDISGQFIDTSKAADVSLEAVDDSKAMDRIEGDPNVDSSDVVAVGSVDITVSNIVDGFHMIVKIPVKVEDDHHMTAAEAYFYNEITGLLESVPSIIRGGEVWIYTNHNTEYIAVATATAEGTEGIYEKELSFEELYPEEDPGQDDTPDRPVINPGWDDDDYVPLPPQIVYEESPRDNTTEIVACAAAAVVAALMAAFLIIERRR